MVHSTFQGDVQLVVLLKLYYNSGKHVPIFIVCTLLLTYKSLQEQRTTYTQNFVKQLVCCWKFKTSKLCGCVNCIHSKDNWQAAHPWHLKCPKDNVDSRWCLSRLACTNWSPSDLVWHKPIWSLGAFRNVLYYVPIIVYNPFEMAEWYIPETNKC